MSRHRRLAVKDVVAETDEACSVVFDVPREHLAWFRARPGQFVTIRVPTPAGDVARCYSLSSGPYDDPAITVKSAGPTSAWLVEHLRSGDELDVLPPAGRFTPKNPDTDLLLIAGGSGITPVMAILRWVLATGAAHVTLVYANRDAGAVIFGRQLALLDIRHPGRLTLVHWLESERGLPSAEALREVLAPYAERETFLCGPEPFMVAVEKALDPLTGRGRLHVERFESLDDDPFAIVAVPAAEDPAAAAPDDGTPRVEVELDGATRTVVWPPQEHLLDVLRSAGMAVPYSCHEGHCGACAVRLLSGKVEMSANDVLEQEDLDDGYVLACQALPRSATARVSYD